LVAVAMHEEPTTAAIQRFLNALPGDTAAEPIIRDLLDRAVRRLRLLCATLLHRSYPRLTRPPLNLETDEPLGDVVAELLTALRTVRPQTVRQFFALATQHMRWQLNDLARRLDEQPASAALPEAGVAAPSSSGDSGLTPDARRMLAAIDGLPEVEREVEALIVPDLPAFLAGAHEPVDNDERLALVGACQFQGRCYAAARLCVEAFAADPTLAEGLASECRARAALGEQQPVGRVEELAARCRYPAARCAALTGCGLSEDGAKLGAMERAHWRKQARDWLRADLAIWANTMDSGPRAARVLVRGLLTHWRTAPDLAGLREPGALDHLPEDERKECLALWKEVEVVLQCAKAHP
jgi:RNA polymerase sigma-70 factor (ECF subfamily)